MMSDLRVITFDGNNVALYDNGSYILVSLPRETIIGNVEKCPTSQVTHEEKTNLKSTLKYLKEISCYFCVLFSI